MANVCELSLETVMDMEVFHQFSCLFVFVIIDFFFQYFRINILYDEKVQE